MKFSLRIMFTAAYPMFLYCGIEESVIEDGILRGWVIPTPAPVSVWFSSQHRETNNGLDRNVPYISFNEISIS